MNAALLLVDLQNDMLDAAELHPPRDQVVARAAALLSAARKAHIPVIHIMTTIRNDQDPMPHWQRTGKRICMEGTGGHQPPAQLRPAEGECVIDKQFFSAFTSPELDTQLRGLGVDTLLIAGVHLHGCVRTTAVDAYQHGYEVWIADDAVAGYDPLHGAISRSYLNDRAARFVSVDAIVAVLNGQVADVTAAKQDQQFVAQATQAVCAAQQAWQDQSLETRCEFVSQLAQRIEADAASLARQIAVEIGKPIRYAREEMAFAVDLIRAAIDWAGRIDEPAGERWRMVRRPLGVVAVITPFNNPLAVPLGKIAPALIYGNAVVWKPAPAGDSIAQSLLRLASETALPPDVINTVSGDRAAAETLMNDPRVNAVTLTGGAAAGYAAHAICARRGIPFQGELGGNNAAIVWSDAAIDEAVRSIADGAFAFAGQRCTANRRAIVHASIYDEFVEAMGQAAAGLEWGDPLDEATVVGPLVSAAARDRVAAVVSRARDSGAIVISPYADSPTARELEGRGHYYPPTIICCDNASAEIVQEETFGPVLVVQRADEWDEAIELCNGVRQGLVAALFSASAQRQEQFVRRAAAGIVKINQSTAGVAADAPFAGCKASSVGVPEHGPCDAEFCTRLQIVYS